MDDETPRPPGPAKRIDVGYKRPPQEHQFKKGQKPPARKKKKAAPSAMPMIQILRNVLSERRRIKIGGKFRWVTASELIVVRAFLEGEKGNATLRREVMRLLLAEPVSRADGIKVVSDPAASENATSFRRVAKDSADGGG